MASDRLSRAHASSGLWLTLSLIATVAACVLFAAGHHGWGIAACAVSCLSVCIVYNNINRLRYRVRYLLSAAISGDFSYKFRDTSFTIQEKEINAVLNDLVSHLEKLGDRTRQNEEFLRHIINLTDSGIVIANERGHILHANKAALKMLDLPVLTDMRQIPEHTDGLETSKNQAALHGEPLTIYTITDTRHTRQNAEVQSWEKLTRVLTHEIMNSLTPINSIAGALSHDSDIRADELRQQMSVISSSSRSLIEFVRNFRKFTVLPAANPKVFYVKPCIKKVVTLMQAQPGAERIEFSVEVFPPDAMMYTDESLLNQVLVNIVKNAVEAQPTKITIKTMIREDETVEIAIANDGAPIPPDVASQIFTPFFTTKESGSGIGLSLSRRIINQLGGSLNLAVHPCTTFTIAL